jgi:hypothetical protein
LFIILGVYTKIKIPNTVVEFFGAWAGFSGSNPDKKKSHHLSVMRFLWWAEQDSSFAA